ncbi:hypothetical protein FE257_011740 [Aspergillus nanangensis]|uniref:Linalool dehydratase/isomerase domain-containing protein n=1 Tax=Aspergillus nanangensis TaxID=2582783 RepID=A0AAD4CV78_ASPNN|nr:hypothetical protein FE257_011740 [Aspergillus nanangensis]
MTTTDSKPPHPPPPSHLSNLLIPPFAGAQKVTHQYQRRTQLQYASLIALGLTGFYHSPNPQIRVAALSCLFPGGGFLAVGGLTGAIGFLLSVAVIPVSLFAWFGAGGLAFVLANWILPGLVATGLVGATGKVWEPSAPVVLAGVTGLVTYGVLAGRRRHAAAVELRASRNARLVDADQEWAARAVEVPAVGEKRELSREQLRILQRFVEVAHQAVDDWEGFTEIDQFQTAALRYQLYDLGYTLALVQKFYLPGFSGYIKSGQERVIEKSTGDKVMNYWKWESLWGKFTLDWDPVDRDNIMVTGYILLSLALYEKLNGDDRYRQKDALNFRITDGAQYLHNTDTIFEALMKNWDNCSYCLFPCEPNWIYSACNLKGMEGAVAYDSYMKTGRMAELLHGRFHRNFEEDFMNADGSIVALRSAITGFPVIGLAGVLGDVGGALGSTAGMPNVARRLWLISRDRNVRKTKDGKYTIENLVGADNMDVGNYKSGPGFAYAVYSACAAEFGEPELARDLIAEMDESLYPMTETPTKALANEGLSLMANGVLFRARVMKRGDWGNLITSGVDERTLAAPKLASVPFPEVMVARCQVAEGGGGVEFVLRGPQQPKMVTLGFQDLKRDCEYRLVEAREDGEWEEVVGGIRGDGDGWAYVQAVVGDRNEFALWGSG